MMFEKQFERIQPYENALFKAAFLFLMLFSLAIVWSVKYLPLQDFPYHLLRFHLELNFDNSALHLSDRMTFSLFPTPYILADYIAYLFGQLLPLQVVGKIVISFYLILTPLSIAYAVAAVDCESKPISLFGFLFVFNWNLNMGFASFIFSIPFFFFSLGYFLKHRHKLMFRHLMILSMLIGCIYLSHPYTFCFFAFAVALLVVFEIRSNPGSARAFLAFIPSLLLLALSLRHDLPKSEVHGFLAFFIPSLSAKLSDAFGNGMPYMTSFMPRREVYLLKAAAFILALLGMIQIVRGHYNRTRRILFLVCLGMFFLYIVLPEHLLMPPVGYIANRVLTFLVILVLMVVEIPEKPALRITALSIGFILSAGYLGLNYHAYHRINHDLSELEAAFETLPTDAKISFWSDKKLSRRGHINPIALFDSYYYINRAGRFIPTISSFAGPLRAIQFKDQSGEQQRIQEVLEKGRRIAQWKGGNVVVIKYAKMQKSDLNAIQYCCNKIFSYPAIAIYTLMNSVPNACSAILSKGDLSGTQSLLRETSFYKMGYSEQKSDYLVLYSDKRTAEKLAHNGYLVLFSRGKSHVLKRQSSQ